MIQNGTFVELNFTGKTTDGIVFDTTDPAIAKTAGLSTEHEYKPIIVCVGQGHVLRGIDEFIVGKNFGKYSLKVSPDKAFGLKDPKLIQLVPASKFKKEGIEPFPGMQIMVDNQMAIVKRVSGGRILIDFNHPLSGMEVVYDVELVKEVTDVKTKFESYVAYAFGPVKTEFSDGVGTMYVNRDVPTEVATILKEQCKKVIPELKDVVFKKEEKKTSESKS